MPAAECFLCFSFWTLKQNKVRVSFVYIGNMCIQTQKGSKMENNALDYKDVDWTDLIADRAEMQESRFII